MESNALFIFNKGGERSGNKVDKMFLKNLLNKSRREKRSFFRRNLLVKSLRETFKITHCLISPQILNGVFFLTINSHFISKK